MVHKEFVKIPREEILSFEEITEIVRNAAELGITKVRVTGGEPLCRKNIEKLIYNIRQIEAIKELVLTTNGVLLKKYAKKLKDAGLDRVNISLDTIDPVLYKRITGSANLNDVLEGIEAAKSVGLKPIKINCVALPFISDGEREKLKDFCVKNGLELQLIKHMDLTKGNYSREYSGNYDRPPKCSGCNKIRLTADGKIYPCLFSSSFISIKNEKSIKEAILKAVSIKEEEGSVFPHMAMASIGG